MNNMIIRDVKEIEREIKRAEEFVEDSRFFSHTYEEGVKNALEWVLGYISVSPMDE